MIAYMFGMLIEKQTYLEMLKVSNKGIKNLRIFFKVNKKDAKKRG